MRFTIFFDKNAARYWGLTPAIEIFKDIVFVYSFGEKKEKNQFDFAITSPK